ncbi:MAG: hypothetical protein QM642_03195 [Edaphocola sp.]
MNELEVLGTKLTQLLKSHRQLQDDYARLQSAYADARKQINALDGQNEELNLRLTAGMVASLAGTDSDAMKKQLEKIIEELDRNIALLK